MKKGFYGLLILMILIGGCAKKQAQSAITVPNNEVLETSTQTTEPIISNSTIDSGYKNVDIYGSSSNRPYSDNGYYGDTSNEIKNIYFGVDKYIITPEMLPTIAHNAKILKQEMLETGAKVKVEGHCDITGTDEYNYALGLRRAKAAKDALIDRGIIASDISIISYGESSPLCTTDYSPQCLAKNRRVEFKIIK